MDTATFNPTGSSGSFGSSPSIASGSLAAGKKATIITDLVAGNVSLKVEPNTQPTTLSLVLYTGTNPSLPGNSVTFKATVTAGSDTPTGTVEFRNNGTTGTLLDT